jgi:hypothetical protein
MQLYLCHQLIFLCKCLFHCQSNNRVAQCVTVSPPSNVVSIQNNMKLPLRESIADSGLLELTEHCIQIKGLVSQRFFHKTLA